MKKTILSKGQHCCPSMENFLEEKSVGVYYHPAIREYSICLRGIPNGKQVIYNCPWCGQKFPKNLLEEYLSTLNTEFGILTSPYTSIHYEVDNDDERPVALPKEFLSDSWWKMRGL